MAVAFLIRYLEVAILRRLMRDGCFMSSHLFLKCSCIALVSGVTAIMPRQNQNQPARDNAVTAIHTRAATTSQMAITKRARIATMMPPSSMPQVPRMSVNMPMNHVTVVLYLYILDCKNCAKFNIRAGNRHDTLPMYWGFRQCGMSGLDMPHCHSVNHLSTLPKIVL